MGAPKGFRPPNAGKGRKKGVPNKSTKAFAQVVQDVIEARHDKIGDWLDRVARTDPARALEQMSKLAEYFAPKLSRTEVTGDAPTAVAKLANAMAQRITAAPDALAAVQAYQELMGTAAPPLLAAPVPVPKSDDEEEATP